jgi:rhamnulokinase
MELNTLYQLLAVQKTNPALLNSADCLLMMPDFFHWCLCGARVAEFTDATTTQFVHPKTRSWSAQLLKRFGLPTKILPEIVQPGTRLGPLLDSVAKGAGMGRIPVIAPASHDTGSAVAAVPTSLKKSGTWAYLSSGTWSLMGVELPQANLSDRVLQYNLTNEGGIDGTYRLLKNIAGLWLLQQCKRSFEKSGKKFEYARLISLAKSTLALRSFVNPEDPRFLNPLDMPAAIQSFCRRTRQPVPPSEGAIVRCVLESLALKYQTVLSQLESVTGQRIEVIHIVGGGSRNRLLNQFTADACQRPVIAGPVEATALGNVLVQARGCKEISSLAELRTVVRNSSDVEHFGPNPRQAEAWANARDRFAGILNRVSS